MNYLINGTVDVLKKRKTGWRMWFVFFILLLSPSLWADISITIQKQTVRQVLKTIERSGDYQFFYNEDLSSLDKIVSISVKNAPIEAVLDELLSGTDLTYKKDKENLIILTLKATSKDVSIIQQHQERIVRGTVTDLSGEPVIGANVLEKGSTNGTITNIDGQFTLNVSDNAVLVISYIGYIEQSITVGNKTDFTIQLQEYNRQIEKYTFSKRNVHLI